MKQISKTYTTLFNILVPITLIFLLASSLGGALNNPYLAYSWYLALICLAMILATSLVAGTMLALSCIFFRYSSRNDPKGSHDWGFTGEVCTGLDRCRNTACPLVHTPSPPIRRAMDRREVVTEVSRTKSAQA
jgi:hypothetical protein